MLQRDNAGTGKEQKEQTGQLEAKIVELQNEIDKLMLSTNPLVNTKSKSKSMKVT